jgi:IMP dehydrogenase
MGLAMEVPIFSANMDTITEDRMCNAMYDIGGRGVLHRFMSIEDNVKMFKKSRSAICSFGIGENEYKRVEALYNEDCHHFILDVAHGASKVAADQYILIKKYFPETFITVGNFATGRSIYNFNAYCYEKGVDSPDAFKVGIGGGAMCTTRVVTGVGVPQLFSIINCVSAGYPIIADGGIKNSGDYAKAMAAGAKAVMLGSMLSGTDETPGIIKRKWSNGQITEYNDMNFSDFSKSTVVKKYRGSASKESYEAQGKTAEHRTAEGESTYVPYKGPMADVINQMQAGLKSSMSYVGAKNLTEFRERATMIKVSNNTQSENGAHGVK